MFEVGNNASWCDVLLIVLVIFFILYFSADNQLLLNDDQSEALPASASKTLVKSEIALETQDMASAWFIKMIRVRISRKKRKKKSLNCFHLYGSSLNCKGHYNPY